MENAHIIDLLKLNNDLSLPYVRRLITPSSSLWKTLEKLFNTRLVYFLESHNIGEGFTLDHLVRVETGTREAFVRRQHFVWIFLGLEKPKTPYSDGAVYRIPRPMVVAIECYGAIRAFSRTVVLR